MEDRPTLDEYIEAKWSALGMPTDKDYAINMRSVEAAFLQSEFMNGLDGVLREAAVAYAPDTKLLFGGDPPPLEVLVKPFDSVKNKCYRQNCIENPNFPGAPPEGFIQGMEMYRRINDLIRSKIVCRYMDGPEFICQKIDEHCKKLGIKNSYAPRANERGYYAWHSYIIFPSEIFYVDAKNINITFEIQVTTQLADVLSALTHGLYEGERVKGMGALQSEWKWRPQELKFQTAYMGHTLHMLEGVILRLKDQVKASNLTTEGE